MDSNSPKSTNRREFIRLTAIGAASAAALAACAPAATPTAAPAAAPKAAEPTKAPEAAKPTEAPKAAAAAPAAAMKVPTFPITLGFVGPMTGDVKTFGESTKNGFDLAVNEANAAGAKITPKYADDKNDATESANATTKLINQDKVKAIIGSVSSKCTIPDSDIANSAKVIVITPTSTNPKVTIADDKRKEYIFRACFIDPFQGTVMAKFALENLKVKKAAVMYDVSNDYSKGLAEFFRDGFTKGGGTVAEFLSYQTKDTDFSALLTKIAAASVDFLFLPDYYNQVSLIAKQAREKGVKAVLGGGDGWDSSDLDVKAVDGGYFSNHYSPDDTRPEVKDWVAKYKAKYNSVPDALATLAYDAANLFIAGAAAAGSDDTAKIKDALAALKDFPTVSGKITFDKNGDPVKSAAIIVVKDGKQNFAATVNP